MGNPLMTRHAKNRPVGITVLALLSLGVGAIYVGWAILGPFRLFRPLASALLNPLVTLLAMIAFSFTLVEGGFFILIGIGLFKMQNWARVLLVVLIGVEFLLGALGLATSGTSGVMADPGPVLIVASISFGVLVYLFRPRIKQAFGAIRF